MTIEDKIWNISQRPSNVNGFTVYTYGLDQPVAGYCVAYVDTQNSFGREGLRHVLKHAQQHSQVIGGWNENGQYYFDSVRVYQTEQAAIEAAIRECQKAYFDLAGRLVKIGDIDPEGYFILKLDYQNKLDQWNAARQLSGVPPFQPLCPKWRRNKPA